MTFAPLPSGPFSAILADPPWHFKTRSPKGEGRSPSRHYKTLRVSELYSLPLRDIAARDSVLFLWVPCCHLMEAWPLMAAWGFKFKSVAFVWVKPHVGLGYWTRQQTELCLLGTRGRPKRVLKSVPQVITGKRREHSRKPDETYFRIEELLGDVPRIELFARQGWLGWTAWGAEAPGAEGLKEVSHAS